ncbi:MAG: GNAT family N-acetyltransferase [Gammaproteobacteria bacterium]|nr:MAG: GNAT family N-acetyltransferase [Gammaproteobacteria bacterium]
MSILLETERLILKTIELSDLDNLVALRSDPEVMKYISQGEIQTKEEVETFMAKAIPYHEKHGLGFCSVFEKESSIFVGQAGLFHLGYDDTRSDIEIGYRLHKKFWGKGYATELAKALIQWGFEHLSIKKLVAVAHPENRGSQRVLEKVGMWYVGKTKYYDNEVLYYEIYKDDLIELVPYNKEWPTLAKLEIERLQEILPKNHVIDIQHVGSTAIPGLSAKSIIDIQIATDSLTTIKPIAIEVLKSQGYEYWADNPDPERLFFVKGMPPFGEKRSHHVHIVESTSKHWQEKILFRDYLITHPEIAQEYENLKKELAQQHTHNREAYTKAKTEFIQAILQKTKS